MGPRCVTDSRVVTDTGPLIHLGEMDALGLFAEFDTVFIPETVHQELADGGVPESYDDELFTRIDVDQPSAAYPQLDPGETAALVLCEQTDAVLLTDDMAARNVASEQNIEGHGSIGIILRAYSAGSLEASKAKSLIRGLKRSTSLYLADPLVEYGLQQIEENESNW